MNILTINCKLAGDKAAAAAAAAAVKSTPVFPLPNN